jgi:alcohol dehydrogenase YqhD (iron-dependent ADH family)
MGGFVRAISRAVFGSPKVIQPVQPQPVKETVKETVDTTKTDKQKLMGAGYGGSTILSSAAGVEDEANVQKTVLGGGKKKKINA